MNRLLAELRARLVAWWRGDAADRDTQDELSFHLDMETEKLIAGGMTPAEARRRAHVALGGVSPTRELARDARGARWFEDVGRDVRFAVRQLRRTPGFTAVAIATLALGIGANTAIFSVIDGVLLQRLPFADPDRLVVVWQTDRRTGTTREPASWPDYLDFESRAETLAGAAAMRGSDVTVSGAGNEATRAAGVAVTHNYFSLLGLDPLIGRAFSEAEARRGGPSVAMLGESFWRSRFGADRAVVGRAVRIDDVAHTIVGVLPDAADFSVDQIHAHAAYHAPYSADGDVDVWVPIQTDADATPRETHPFFVVARVDPGVPIAAAREELERIAGDLESAYPANAGRGVFVEPLEDMVFGPVRPVLALMGAAVLLVLLVACVNVANLLLARGMARVREVAVRTALGASLGRLGRQFLVEAVLIGLLGGLVGVGLAYVGLDFLLALAPADVPRLADVRLDARVLGLTLAVSVLVGAIFGLVPTLQATRVDAMQAIRGEGTGRSVSGRRARELLVGVELALSVMLVVGAGLLIRSFRSVLEVDPGFRAERVLKAELVLPASRYPRDFSRWPEWTEVQGFQSALLSQVRELPGVSGAAIAGSHPLDAGFTNSFVVVGREAEAADWPEISVRIVSPEYFATLGVELRQGQSFTDRDAPGAPPVALINETAGRLFFPDRDPAGHEIRFWGISRRIVGVSADERIHGVTADVPPAVYIPIAQAPSRSGATVLLVQTAGDPLRIVPDVRRIVSALDPELAVYGIERLSETLLASVGSHRFAMLVLTTFAVVTLVLALVGIHGVVSYMTSQRTHEFGVRAALGASQGSLSALVLRRGVGLTIGGTLVGLIGAYLGSALLAGLLFGVSRADPITFVAVPALMAGGALFAAWLPARRAARVAPVEALRAE